MGVQATFNYTSWLQMFPEFGSVSEIQVMALESGVVEASLIRNDGGGPVSNAATQLALLNFATAHVVQIFAGSSQQNVSPLVGRISNATQGSVSVAADMPTGTTPNAAYWNQTKYGATAWAMLSPYRTMRYVVSPAAYGGYAGAWRGGFGRLC